MTKGELTQYLELNKKFNNDCDRITNALTELSDDFHHVYTYYIDEDDVTCKGDYTCYGETEYITMYFPTELLAYTDEQLQEYVKNKLEEKRKEEEKRKKIKEENQRNVELELLRKLKEKYEQ